MTGTLAPLFPFVMMAAFICGVWLSQHYKSELALLPSQKVWIGMCAFSGAILAAKLPFLVPGLPGFVGASGLLVSGKTILFGMVGGYAGVEFAKSVIGTRLKTGDYFVVPVATSIGIGRLGCFCGGCCHGVPTTLPWGVHFAHVDDQLRHPTQIYEAAFHLAMAAVCAWLYRQGKLRHQLIKFYFLTYFAFRFLSEFVRPEARLAAGLTVYQWTCLVLIPVFVWLWIRDAKACYTN